MLKKLAIVGLMSGFTIASFAQAPVASTPAKPATPVAAEHKAETPKPVKHMKKHHSHKKAATGADTTAAPAK